MNDPCGTMPLFDHPAPRKPSRPKSAELAFRKYTGTPVTCHLCVRDALYGTPRGPRENARKVVRRGEAEWLVCDRHAGLVRNNERELDSR